MGTGAQDSKLPRAAGERDLWGLQWGWESWVLLGGHVPTCVPTALDTTKDPCQKVKCSRHKVCVAQGYQRAMCISRKKLEHR